MIRKEMLLLIEGKGTQGKVVEQYKWKTIDQKRGNELVEKRKSYTAFILAN